MVVDLLRCGAGGSNWWRLCLTTNGSLFGMAPFMELIGFDLRKTGAPSTGRRYWWGLPISMSAKLHGTDFRSLVDFAALVTRFSSTITT
jgi:hypothetical protein